MTKIEIEPSGNSYHNNGTADPLWLYDGWALVRPEDVPILHESCGSVTFDVEEVSELDTSGLIDKRSSPSNTFPVAVNMVKADAPEPTSAPAPVPAAEQKLRADVDYLAAMSGVDLEV